MKLGHDLSGVEAGYTGAVPAGNYTAQLTEIREDIKTSYSPHIPDKQAALLTWTVMDLGPYLGAKIFDRLNLEGYSDESQLVSLRKLKAIANAIGHKNPNFVADTDELLQQPCIIRVGMGKGDFADRNEVKGYMSIKDNAPKSDTASKATATPTKPAQVAQRPPVQKTEPKPANRSTPPPITKKPSAPLETLQNEDGRRTPFERPVVEEVVSDVNADDLIEEIKDKDPEF